MIQLHFMNNTQESQNLPYHGSRDSKVWNDSLKTKNRKELSRSHSKRKQKSYGIVGNFSKTNWTRTQLCYKIIMTPRRHSMLTNIMNFCSTSRKVTRSIKVLKGLKKYYTSKRIKRVSLSCERIISTEEPRQWQY